LGSEQLLDISVGTNTAFGLALDGTVRTWTGFNWRSFGPSGWTFKKLAVDINNDIPWVLGQANEVGSAHANGVGAGTVEIGQVDVCARFELVEICVGVYWV
jgi:hypothetical protein